MRYLTLFILIISFQIANAQLFVSDHWNYGEVVMNDGDIIKGMVSFDLNENIIQIKKKEIVKTYNSNQFQSFNIKIYSMDTVFRRDFYSVPFRVNTGYNRPRIFELLYQGELNLLAREYLVISDVRRKDRYQPLTVTNRRFNVPNPAYYKTAYLMAPRANLDFNLFLVDGKGRIFELPQKPSEILKVFDDLGYDLKSYAKKEKLQLRRVDDVMALLKYIDTGSGT